MYYFFTHHKCATIWLVNILSRYCSNHQLGFFTTHFSYLLPDPNVDYSILVYTNSEYAFCKSRLEINIANHNQTATHIIRNPLDLIVSAYYSHLYSHPLDGWSQLAQQREILRRINKKAGLRATWYFLERSDFDDCAVGPLFSLLHWNFDDGTFKTLRMEDLVINAYDLLQKETHNFFRDDLAGIVTESRFEKLSGGRPTGIVDKKHHYRSGRPNQWMDELDLSLAHAVYDKYKSLIDAYYPEVKGLLGKISVMIDFQKCWCGNTDLDAYSEDYLKCAACETLVARHMPQPDIARVTDDENDFYGREYWFSHMEKDLGYVNITVRAKTDLPERCLYWLRTLLKYKLPPGDVLEIGCSHGGFTALLRMAGFVATGLEISPWVVDYARNAFGIPVLLGPVEDQQIEPCSLDVIAMMDVLEHLPDPVTTLMHCLKLLRPDGVMLLQTPRYPEFVTYDRLVEKNVPFIELLKDKGHLYLFSETSVRKLLGQLGLEHIRFEPAIFAHYDMFLLAGRAPLEVSDFESIQNMLCANPNGRIMQAFLDLEHQCQDFRKRCEEFQHQRLQLSEQNAALTSLLHESEADRAVRLDRIRQLTELLRESDKDREARFEQIQQLTKLLYESEADRAARLEQIEELSKRLSESDKDREARFEQIQQLTRLLHESEADRLPRRNT